MQENLPLEWLFIVNTGSGSNNANSYIQMIKDFFSKKTASFYIHLLPQNFTIAEVSSKIDELTPKKVVAVGGDGTVNMLANILAGKDIPLGILPGGSANGMARELGIPESPPEALEIINTGVIRHLDRICINDKYFCLHLSDLGLNAKLIKYFDEGKLRGKLGYSKVILKTLLRRKKIYASIRTGDNVRNEIAYMIVLANASMYGTGAVINPDGKPDDGSFEAIIVRNLSFIALFKMLFKPGLFDPKHIEIFSCTSVEIMTTRPSEFQVDGEYLGKQSKVHARIQPAVVKMIVPRN